MSDLGVVAIGRNEGERLRRCLESLAGLGLATVYVDSGSDDGSVPLARSMGVEVVELAIRPFSAARARNEGFARLKAIAPEARYAMFVDGDCEVADGWIDRARAELEARPDAAVVCGRRREKFPERTIYNRLADLEWDTPIGQAVACGGDSVMRVAAFDAVGGFDPTAVAGEEPELCQRLRNAGWTIWRVDAEMTRHDIDMTRVRQYWRRHYRSGYNGLDICARFPGEARLFRGEIRRARLWAGALPLAIAGLGLGAGLAFGPRVGLAVAACCLMAYPLQAARQALNVRTQIGGTRAALGYGILTTLAKGANLVGQWNYLRDRRAGRMAALIEYKVVAPAAPSSP